VSSGRHEERTDRCPRGHVLDPGWDHCLRCEQERREAADGHPTIIGTSPGSQADAQTPLAVRAADPPGTPRMAGVPAAGEGEGDGGQAGQRDEGDAEVTLVSEVPAGAATSVVAWLVIGSGPHRGRDLRLRDGANVIGSGAQCDIRLADDVYVSNRHAELQLTDQSCQLRDLSSRNGTFVNGERIDRQPLQDGDALRLGLTRFIFKSCRLPKSETP
jgi:hypothetical protein